MSIRKSSHRFVLATIVIAAITATASANWLNFLNPFASAEEPAQAHSIAPVLFTTGTCESLPGGVIEVEGTGGSGAQPTGYSTLGAAFTAINGGVHTGTIVIDVCGDTTEAAASSVLNASGSGSASYTSILISPVGGVARTITAATTAGSPMIDLNGADNVTINGLNTGGSSLTITNTTASATSGTSTVRLQADATNNLITNANIQGSASMAVGTNGGNIWFGSAAITTGNDNNTVSNCNIGPAGANLPTKGIYGTGTTTTATLNNSGNTITGNNIFDYFGAAVQSSGIYLTTGSTAWTITNNKFYQSATRTITTGTTHSGIYIANTGNGDGFTITGNTIGYANSSGTGTYTIAGAFSNVFYGIYLSPLSTSTTNNIGSNIISDISFTTTSSGTTAGSYPFAGINFASTAAQITVNNNTVRNINFPGTGSGTFLGIDANSSGSGAHLVNGNTISNFARSANGPIYGIKMTSPTSITLNNNNISGLALNNSTATSVVYGIYGISSAVNVTANGNTITNLTSTSTSTVTIRGIYEFGVAGNKVFQNNTINNLSAAGGATINGIQTSAVSSPNPMDISGNTINTLSGGVSMAGISQTSSTSAGNIYKNKIFDISTTNTSPTVAGISITAGTVTVYNNLIGDLRASAANSDNSVRGINITSTTTLSNVNIYYNSIYLNAPAGGTNFGSSGVFHTGSATSTTARLDLRNNVIVNTSFRNGTGATAALWRTGSSVFANFATTSNNNLFYAGTPGPTNLLYYDGANTMQTIGAYKALVSPRDSASISENPPFLSTTGSSPNFLHINPAVPTFIESGAASVAGITDDFDGDVRNVTTPDIGADEGTFTAPLANDMAASAFIDPVSGGTKLTGVAFSPQASFVNNGTATQSGVTVRYRIVDAGLVEIYNQTATTGTILSGGSETVTFPSTSIATAGTYSIFAKVELGTDTVPGNDQITGTLMVKAPLTGSYTVGSGGNFATLTAAIAELNSAGVAGATTLSLTDATYSGSETFPLVINSIPGASSTNTVTIAPAASNVATISGAAASGCLIRLNGADYVTIDGSNSGGTDRSLTLTNTSTTSPATVCISSLGTGAGATNNTVKNTNISTGISAAAGYGISVGSGTGGGVSGADNDNTTIQNNSITVASIGVYAAGTTAVSTGGNDTLAITGNTIDSNTTIQNYGIQVGNATGAAITGNSVSVQTSGAFQPTGISLETGFVSSAVSGNTISKALATNSGGYGGRGITIGTGTATSALTIANNAIYGVNGTNWSSFGNSSSMGIAIGMIGGSTTITTTAGGLNLYYNSVSMTGSMGSASTTALTTALYVGSGASALDIRNNVLTNTQTATSTTQKNYAIYSAAANTAFTNINYNDYYVANSFNAGSAILGFLTSDRTTLTAVQTGFGGNLNSVSGNPQFLDPAANLHISTVLTTPVESSGTPIVGITTDIDGNTRNVSTPDIGADEGTFIAPVTNDMQATAFIDPTDAGSKLANTVFAPQASFTNNGTATQTAVPVQYRICSDSICSIEYYNDSTQTIASISTGVTTTVTFSNVVGGLAPGVYTIKAKALLGTDTVPANDEITGTLNVLAPLNGTYTVGSGGNYPSLTNNGGIFQALNALGISGQVFINITSNLTGETGTHQLNDITAGNNITIRPFGGPRTITGSSAGSLIVINGADNVVIDGSGTDANAGPAVGGDSSLRNLTITNTNTGTASAVVSIHTGTNGATNNTIKNLNVVGSSSTAGTLVGIEISGNTVASAGADNDINRIENCSVQKSLYGIVAFGASAANQNQQNFINRNDLSATGTNRIGLNGIVAFNVDNLQIHENSIGGITSTASADSIGIAAGTQSVSTSSSGSGGITNGTIRRNKVNGVAHTATFSAVGIAAACTTCELSNNMVTGVIADATSPDFPAGIFVVSGAGTSTNVFHNSVSMTEDRGATTSQMPGYAIAITGADTPVGMINNILSTSQTASGGGVNAKSYALGVVTSNINFTAEGNDYWSVGANDGGIRVGSLASAAGTDYATLGAFQLATGKDNAVPGQEVDPQFVNPANDLHLTNPATNTLLNAGYNNQWPPVDFDNDPRPTTVPPQTNLPHADIGADEVVQADGGVIPTGSYYNAILGDGDTTGGAVTISGTLYVTGEASLGDLLILGCNANVVGAGGGNYVVGSVQKQFCSTGAFAFPVGTASNGSVMGTPPEFTPMTATITAGTFPSSLTVNVVDDFLPGLVQSSAVSRYWSVVEIGDLTVDMTFTYLDTDVNGNEANYKVFRHNAGVTTEITPNSNNPAGNTATVLNVSNFSDWGIGALVPTASEASISGRVTTGGGAGIKNAAIVVTGNSLSRPIIVKTGSLGYYMVEGLQAGETYVVTVVSKRFTFQVPSRIISLTDSITDVDFVANPE